MSFASQGFGQRFGRMGDEAEDVFEDEAPLGQFSRFGWNRNANFRNMPKFIATTPDYYCSIGYLVEVMGCSGQWFNAMKLDKWEAMKEWNAKCDLAFFIWNTKERTWALVDWGPMKRLVAEARREGRIGTWESDGNQYYRIPWRKIVDLSSDTGVRV